MSHIHLPDGVIPTGWWLLGYIAAFVWLSLALRHAEAETTRRKLPFLAAMSALMLLTMSIPLGPLPFHLNLAVLTGIVVGPWLGFVAVLVVNIMLSFLGHGGLTTIGINTLITGLEVVLGWWLYHRLLGAWHLNWRALTATGLALLLSSTLAMSAIGLSTGVLDVGWHEHEGEQHVHHDITAAQPGDAATGANFLGLGSMGAVALILATGVAVEALATWVIISYVQKVRPELLLEESDL